MSGIVVERFDGEIATGDVDGYGYRYRFAVLGGVFAYAFDYERIRLSKGFSK